MRIIFSSNTSGSPPNITTPVV